MHRAALPSRNPFGLAQQLSDHQFRSNPPDNHVRVTSIGRDDGIIRSGRALHPDGDRLLADVEMTKSADLAHRVQLSDPLFQSSQKQHAAVDVEQLTWWQAQIHLLMPIGHRFIRCRRPGREARQRREFPRPFFHPFRSGHQELPRGPEPITVRLRLNQLRTRIRRAWPSPA